MASSVRRKFESPPVDPKTPHSWSGNNGGRLRHEVDWPAFLRRVERKRRLLGKSNDHGPSDAYYAIATYTSFRLEGLEVSEHEVTEALGPNRTMLRSRQAQRIRNHAAILHHIENDLRENLPLRTEGVVRWYTAISAGLSTTGLDRDAMTRLENMVRRINSPQMRIRAALQEIAMTHSHLLADPLVPAFNGILARLLLRYHLGRCNLPPVMFDPQLDGRPGTLDELVGRLVQLVDESFEARR